MAAPKILVIPGSLRAKSYNVRLAALATKELTLADAEVTRISLFDYPLPIYDADTAETAGPPSNAVKLKQLMSAHQGVFIASPGIQRLDHAADQEHDRLDFGRARARRGAARRLPESGVCAGWRLARAFWRDAFIAGAAPSAGGRLPRAGDRGAGDGAQCGAGLRRDGRTQGCARGRSAQ